ncbi:hypothetical protein X777_06112 [Ooceraea biroi]|uniref:YqaJ viral recombinase domain-containing protein n=1 Tax=Ooceraea biroi TaxID=2015173 RepID=A0A026X285_OOCBI|nr:hypothetical protein X777_06112 [Ooceraea biroi]
MLTASNFGIVCRMRPTTSCAATVKSILFPPSIETVAMKYGRDMEEVARKQIAVKLKKDITACGLFIDEENPCLGASPDGLIDEDGLLEIKCPLSAENLTADEASQKLPQFKTVFDRKNPDKMNPKHRYFYQVQGQLNITRRDYCIFVVWTPKSFKIMRVSRDEVFWKNQMLPFLTRFYYECMLPEILDSRFNRHLPIRDPRYIHEAKESKNACKRTNSSVGQRKIFLKDETAEQISPLTEPSAVSHSEKQDDDCIIISYSNEKREITEEDAKRMKNTLDDTIVPFSLLEQNILPLHSKVNDESLDAFLRIVREMSPFETQSVQYLECPQLIDASTSVMSIQIIGGNCTDHWRCIFFDGSKLHVYDSIPGCTYHKLAAKEKDYIRKRFPQINVSDIIFEKVQTQPDSIFFRFCVIKNNSKYSDTFTIISHHFSNYK